MRTEVRSLFARLKQGLVHFWEELKTGQPNPFREPRRFRPGLELLEDRIVPFSPGGGSAPVITAFAASLVPSEQTILLSGTVTDSTLSAVTINFTGAAIGSTTVADSHGDFHFLISGTQLGTVYAQATAGSLTSSQVHTDLAVVTMYSPGDQANLAGDVVQIPLAAWDSHNYPLDFSATGLPSGLSIDSDTGVVSGTIALSAYSSSPYSVSVTALDAGAHVSVSKTFIWTVDTAAVDLTNPADQNSMPGDAVQLDVFASSSAGDTLSFSASGLPTGLSIDSSTGIISGTIDSSADTSSPYSVTVTATDATASVSASKSFNWVVTTHLYLTNPGSQSGADSDVVSLSTTAGDFDNNPLTYSATGLPTGLSIDSDTGIISGTIGSSAHLSSPFSVTITVSDSTASLSTYQTFSWTVAQPVVKLTNPGDQVDLNNDVVSLSLTASDLYSNPLTFSATGLPTGLSINSSTGVISGTIGSSADTASPYSVTVTATDSTASVSVDRSFTWYVSQVFLDTPDDQTNLIGDSISLSLTAFDGSGNTLTFSATGLPTGVSINSSTGVISGTIGSGADADSPYSIIVTAADSTASASASQSFTWNVSAAAVSLDAPDDQTNLDGDPVELDLFATSAFGSTLTYSASGLPDGLSLDTSTGIISGTIDHTALASSPFSLTISASDGTTTASQSFSWTISPLITITPPGTQINQDGETVNLSLTTTDAYQNPLSFSATGLPTGLEINSDTGFISGTISSSGSFSVTITATDSTESVSTTKTFTWTVNASVVTLTNPGFQAKLVGDTVSLSLSAADADSNPLTFTVSGLPAGLSINSSTGVISGTISSGADNAIPYVVTVTATDSTAGISTTQKFNWIVSPASVTPSMTLYAQVLPGKEVKLFGRVTDVNPSGVTVTFSGTASGSTTTDATGYYSYMTTSATLGTVSASGVDTSSASTSTVSATIATPAPIVTMFITETDEDSVTLSGWLTDVDVASQTITLGGVTSTTVTTDAKGHFSTTVTATGLGDITADITDQWGQDATTTVVSFAEMTQVDTRIRAVSDSGDGDGRFTLRSRIRMANAYRGTLPFRITFNLLEHSTINLQTELPTLERDVRIIGPGADQLTIRRNSTDAFRIFQVNINVDASIRSLTVANGNASGMNTAGFGGGVFNLGTLELWRVTMTGNQAVLGGAVYNVGVLTVGFSTFINNQATDRGGAILNRGEATIGSATRIVGNFASSGGGIFNGFSSSTDRRGMLRIEGGTWILDNTATGANGPGAGYGGGIASFGTLILSNVDITANTSLREGGGLFCETGTSTLTNVSVEHNQATGRANGKGGGIYARSGRLTLVSGCIVSGNTAAVLGDGIGYKAAAMVTIDFDNNRITDDVLNEDT